MQAGVVIILNAKDVGWVMSDVDVKDYRIGFSKRVLQWHQEKDSDQLAYCRNCDETFFIKTTPPLRNSSVPFDFCSKCHPEVGKTTF